jgi:acyl-coenzyme A synthetase/AMP-(fatty) acid ligase
MLISSGKEVVVVIHPGAEQEQLECVFNDHGNKVLICKICGYRSEKLNNAKRHVATVHGPWLGLKCHVCAGHYKNHQGLTRHIRISHPDQLLQQLMMK